MRRDFQFLQRFYAEIVVQPRREYFPDARDRGEDGNWIALAAKPSSMASRPCRRMSRIERAMLGPMPGISPEAFDTFLGENIRNGSGPATQDASGMTISPDAKPVRALLGKNTRDLIQPICDVEIGAG